ncbi:MAG: hypothetical protein K1X83_14995 [Oligoflexia bacterium]|nr:hypothetical protein [Oligoflexia bacterium]
MELTPRHSDGDAGAILPAAPDAQSQALSAWSEDHLTAAQLRWMENEVSVLRRVVAKCTRDKGQAPVMYDVGCGIPARLFRDDELGSVIDSVQAYVGIDNEPATIEEARLLYGQRGRFLDPMDYHEALSAVEGGRAELIICLGNTLGTLPGDRTAHVKFMGQHADTLLISVVRKGPDVLRERIAYYEKNGINCQINWDTNIIHSDVWGDSLAFGEGEFAQFSAALREAGMTRVSLHASDPLGTVLVAQR